MSQTRLLALVLAAVLAVAGGWYFGTATQPVEQTSIDNGKLMFPDLAAKLLAEAQDDVEREWRVYSARAAMPGRGETPNIAPPEKPEVKLAAAAAGGEK